MNTFLISIAVIFFVGFVAGRLTVSEPRPRESYESPETAEVPETSVPKSAEKDKGPSQGEPAKTGSSERELLNQIASMNQPCPLPEVEVPEDSVDPEDEVDTPYIMDGDPAEYQNFEPGEE